MPPGGTGRISEEVLPPLAALEAPQVKMRVEDGDGGAQATRDPEVAAGREMSAGEVASHFSVTQPAISSTSRCSRRWVSSASGAKARGEC
jgi:hypothetical protein